MMITFDRWGNYAVSGKGRLKFVSCLTLESILLHAWGSCCSMLMFVLRKIFILKLICICWCLPCARYYAIHYWQNVQMSKILSVFIHDGNMFCLLLIKSDDSFHNKCWSTKGRKNKCIRYSITHEVTFYWGLTCALIWIDEERFHRDRLVTEGHACSWSHCSPTLEMFAVLISLKVGLAFCYQFSFHKVSWSILFFVCVSLSPLSLSTSNDFEFWLQISIS